MYCTEHFGLFVDDGVILGYVFRPPNLAVAAPVLGRVIVGCCGICGGTVFLVSRIWLWPIQFRR